MAPAATREARMIVAAARLRPRRRRVAMDLAGRPDGRAAGALVAAPEPRGAAPSTDVGRDVAP